MYDATHSIRVGANPRCMTPLCSCMTLAVARFPLLPHGSRGGLPPAVYDGSYPALGRKGAWIRVQRSGIMGVSDADPAVADRLYGTCVLFGGWRQQGSAQSGRGAEGLARNITRSAVRRPPQQRLLRLRRRRGDGSRLRWRRSRCPESPHGISQGPHRLRQPTTLQARLSKTHDLRSPPRCGYPLQHRIQRTIPPHMTANSHPLRSLPRLPHLRSLLVWTNYMSPVTIEPLALDGALGVPRVRMRTNVCSWPQSGPQSDAAQRRRWWL